MHLYRIAQEALSNAMKHGKANHVTISLRKDDGLVRLVIGDDGNGMPKATSSSGMGLRTMKYRAELIGARLEMAPRPSGGTIVSCDMRAERLAKPMNEHGREH
jgi:signal transduction histidine kinase